MHPIELVCPFDDGTRLRARVLASVRGVSNHTGTPNNIASLDQNWYADDTCSVDNRVAAAISAQGCPTASFALRLDNLDCALQCSVFALEQTLDSYFLRSADACVEGLPDATI